MNIAHSTKILIAGIVGSGKSTLAKELQKKGLRLAKSCTTRPRRAGEGEDYYFISKEEAAQVDPTKKLIGTTYGDVEYFLLEDEVRKSDLFILDPNGINDIIAAFPEYSFVLVYVKPVSIERAEEMHDSRDSGSKRFAERYAVERPRFEALEERLYDPAFRSKFSRIHILTNDYTNKYLQSIQEITEEGVIMINIRTGVFETNSSSNHAFVIRKNNQEPESYTPYADKDGVLRLNSYKLEFGRAPFEVLYDPYRKACYAIASFGEERFNEIEDILKEVYPYIKKIELPTEWDYDDELDKDTKAPYYGYIDHQSTGLLSDVMSNYNITLKEFITDPRYVIMVDGDEYDVFGDLIRTKFITKENTEDIYRSFGQRFDWEKKGEDAE